ncbi:C40 family peptidase [Bacillus sp. ISL-75]|uniref:NlpC/P60 family protein n=1 Tax=Bacillus sp. ISL-75 TaxID=2819137 RepID=UPI001BE970C6|nr:NlpC/P60 family protein [Bacillus sp. ISL-75]MBT2728378.1 C40 family peptidase [Bacillus sp. ISL-75]
MKKRIAALIFLMLFAFSTAAQAQHYVTKGDTMYSISREHKMNLKDLISLNPHIKNPNILHINDYIIIRSGTETQQDMVDYAKSLQSITAYSYGGQNFPYQTDCSGFVQGVFKKFGKTIPRVSRDQAIDPKSKPVKFEDLQIGDLMFFSNRADKVISHVGIYMGNDYWISNLNSAKDVEILSSWGKWSRENFMWGTRYEL